jgi:hypothetical protein
MASRCHGAVPNRCTGTALLFSFYYQNSKESENIMNHHKTLIALAGLLIAGSAFAQNQETAKPQPESQRHSSANSPAIGQAVSGHNSTAAGVSGTGLRTDGTADTGSAHTGQAMEAAGVNGKGQVTSKSTSVIGSKGDNVNAQATNTTSPNNTDKDPAATGGRGKTGTKAEKEVMKANARAVHEVPGDRMKTDAAVKSSQKKHAKSKEKGEQKAAAQGQSGS